MKDAERIQSELSELLSIPAQALLPETQLQEHSSWDSLAQMSIIALAIELTGTNVADWDLTRVETLQDIYDMVADKKQVA